MTPRNLRHRLEKSAKLLVTIQKYLPHVSCRFDDDRGESGQVIVDLAKGDSAERLGTDLEGRGYRFTRTRNAWLGNVTFRGEREGQPGILISMAIQADRLNRAEVVAEPYTFRPS